MLVVVHRLKFWRYFLEGATIKTLIYSDHQNLTYFKNAIMLHRQQARWLEDLRAYNFEIIYRKGMANVKADIFSRCLAFTTREGDITSAMNQTMFDQEQ
jgi:hypothetical protein